MVVDRWSEERIDRVFHALADATRRDIVRRSMDGDLSVSALARAYPMSVTAVQKHVAVLADAGLVTRSRHGREQRVRTDITAVRHAQALLDELEVTWRARIARIDDILAEPDPGETRP